jgi:hypothetical protein
VRNLFLALVLANLLVGAWQLWIVPGEVPATALASPSKEAELALVTADPPATRGERPAGLAETLPPGPAATGGQCFRIGPLAEGGAADAVRKRLQREGISVSQSSEDGQIWVGHWVQIPNAGNRQQAEAAVSKLDAGGLPDAYVLDVAGSISISLGVFRDRQRADKVVADAQRLGFQPVVTDRHRPGVQYWLLANVPAGRSAALPDMGRESGQILRSERVPCAQAEFGAAAAIN